MATQLRQSDSFIFYKPLEKALMQFDPAYTVLTASAAYPSEINKKDRRNLDGSITPKVEEVKDAVITWHDEKQWARTVDASLTSDWAANATTITLPSGKGVGFVPKQILEVTNTGEHVVVSAVSGDTLTIVRAPASESDCEKGQVAATAITGGTQGSPKTMTLKVLGTSLFDKDTASAMRAAAVTNEYKNYVQIFDSTYELTEQTEAYQFMGGPVKIRLSKRGAREASYNLEDTFTYGQLSKTVDSSNSDNVRYTMMGLIPAIKAYQDDSNKKVTVSGALTFDKVMAFENLFQSEGIDDVTYLCSKKALGYFDKFAQTYVRLQSVDNAFGIRITKVTGTLGDIKLVHLPALDMPGNNVELIRFNPQKDMKILQASPWKYKECGKDTAQTYTTHWLHGAFSAKFNLIPEKAGFIAGFDAPYSM